MRLILSQNGKDEKKVNNEMVTPLYRKDLVLSSRLRFSSTMGFVHPGRTSLTFFMKKKPCNLLPKNLERKVKVVLILRCFTC